MLVRILNTLRSRIWDMVFFLFSDYSKSTVGENGGLYTNLFEGLKKRKPQIWDRRKCEDSRGVENACLAFLLAPTSHFLLSQISGFLFFGSRRKLVIYVGKRREFSRRLWLLIKELLIARDADRRNKTPYINVSFLEFDFLESHIFLEIFILTNKNHRLLDNPHSHQLWV